MSRIKFIHSYQYIISFDNLLGAWGEFVKGKRSRRDVQEFELDLMNNIISLQRSLTDKTYRHSGYESFNICDPKPRNIHKAIVRDRLLHHALYRTLYPFFARTFFADSHSCQLGKGTHKVMNRLRTFMYKVSENHTKTAWALKGDIRKFFPSIDQSILLKIIADYIPDKDIRWLIYQVVNSFHSGEEGVGLPLGNLTSQLFVNVYMNVFDQFVKHKLKAKYYIRYADDFVILSPDRKWLLEIIPEIRDFLWEKLHLELHPNKLFLQTVASGLDFLGWVHFPDHRVLRTAAKKRMFRTIEEKSGKSETVQSYLGLISHGNAMKLRRKIEEGWYCS
ncbi:MAG: hypothetical protein HQ530_03605 [Parcubacteria group bacterium]|nr:hypothetical protein [Parcubacteria group bacterium]